MPYSEVTHPVPRPRIQAGTDSSTMAVHTTRVRPIENSESPDTDSTPGMPRSALPAAVTSATRPPQPVFAMAPGSSPCHCSCWSECENRLRGDFAGFRADLSASFEGADVRLLAVTAGVVALLLLITYRSPVLWLVPLLVVGTGDRLATVAVGALAPLAGVLVDPSDERPVEVLGRYSSGPAVGTPALTARRTGTGTAHYLATIPDDAGVLALWLVGGLAVALAGAIRITSHRTLRDLRPSLIG